MKVKTGNHYRKSNKPKAAYSKKIQKMNTPLA